MSNFTLQVLTPEHVFLEGACEMLVVPTVDGELGILAGHEPLLLPVVPGEMRITQNGVTRAAACGEGFATVTPDQTLVLLQTVEWPEEIDRNRAQRAKERAEEALRQRRSMQEYNLARTTLQRAMVRLRVTGRRETD